MSFWIGRWCRREWSSPPDARNAEATRRLYSSVFLGSPGKFWFHWLLHMLVSMKLNKRRSWISIRENFKSDLWHWICKVCHFENFKHTSTTFSKQNVKNITKYIIMINSTITVNSIKDIVYGVRFIFFFLFT